jgi:hypothetical protein
VSKSKRQSPAKTAVQYVDRIIAGEFDNPKQDGRRKKQATGGNL